MYIDFFVLHEFLESQWNAESWNRLKDMLKEGTTMMTFSSLLRWVLGRTPSNTSRSWSFSTYLKSPSWWQAPLPAHSWHNLVALLALPWTTIFGMFNFRVLTKANLFLCFSLCVCLWKNRVLQRSNLRYLSIFCHLSLWDLRNKGLRGDLWRDFLCDHTLSEEWSLDVRVNNGERRACWCFWCNSHGRISAIPAMRYLRRGCENSRILPIQRSLGLANTGIFHQDLPGCEFGWRALAPGRVTWHGADVGVPVRGNFVETCTMWHLWNLRTDEPQDGSDEIFHYLYLKMMQDIHGDFHSFSIFTRWYVNIHHGLVQIASHDVFALLR